MRRVEGLAFGRLGYGSGGQGKFMGREFWGLMHLLWGGWVKGKSQRSGRWPRLPAFVQSM